MARTAKGFDVEAPRLNARWLDIYGIMKQGDGGDQAAIFQCLLTARQGCSIDGNRCWRADSWLGRLWILKDRPRWQISERIGVQLDRPCACHAHRAALGIHLAVLHDRDVRLVPPKATAAPCAVHLDDPLELCACSVQLYERDVGRVEASGNRKN